VISRFGTVSLWVDDFDTCIPFYRDILGLELTTRPGEVPHFLVGESMLVLVKGDFCPPEDAFPPDFPQVTFEVDDLDDAFINLNEEEVELVGRIEERRDSRWFQLRDPSGNLLQMVEVKR